ncbi:MAG: hypothetical protein NZ108_10545, partial [Bacteroidia bacterium]|nr:hypothetical protein [Bacteroidia bacterium]
MKSYLLCLSFFAALSLSVSAQNCTPNGSPIQPGVYVTASGIDTLPDATVGVPYNQNLTIVMPKDSIVNARDILSFPGLP